jgi:hypothetical protein
MASSERHRYNESSCHVLELLVELLNLQHVKMLGKSRRNHSNVADSSDGSHLILGKLHLVVVHFIFSYCN